MKPGQTRVVVLLIVLLALEMVIHPAIHPWLSQALTPLKTLGGNNNAQH
jgi:hypothetical protein